jgi:hypothetical protein
MCKRSSTQSQGRYWGFKNRHRAIPYTVHVFEDRVYTAGW